MSWKAEHERAKLANLSRKYSTKQFASGSKRGNSISAMSNTTDMGPRKSSLPTFQLNKSFLSPSNVYSLTLNQWLTSSSILFH